MTDSDVVLIRDPDCPNVASARTNLSRALGVAGRPPRWREYDRNDAETPAEWRAFGSPTILVDGRDVGATEPTAGGNSCRVYRSSEGRLVGVPSVEQIAAALGQARAPGSTSPVRSQALRGSGAGLAGLGALVTAVAASACCWLPLALIALGFSAAGVGALFERYQPILLAATFAFLTLAWGLSYRSSLRRFWARLTGRPVSFHAADACCASNASDAFVSVPPISKEQSSMTSDNHSCCSTDPALNSAECAAPPIGEPLAEPVAFGESPPEPSAAQIPPRRFTWGSFNRVMLGAASGMAVLFVSFPYWSDLVLGSVTVKDHCCGNAFPKDAAVPTLQAGTVAGPCCEMPNANAAAASALQAGTIGGPCCVAPKASTASTRQPGTGADACCPVPKAAAPGTAIPGSDVPQPSGPAAETGKADGPAAVSIDPTRNAVFMVQGLECPAVAGLGCGHRVAPVLAGLDKLEGVERSLANRTGTMIRVTAAVDQEKVAGQVAKYLADSKRTPVRLVGDQLRRALDNEEWRDARRIAELSGIEFRTLFLRRVAHFAKAENLDEKITRKLTQLSDRQWDRIPKAGDPKAVYKACEEVADAIAHETDGLLSREQIERLKRALTAPPSGVAQTELE